MDLGSLPLAIIAVITLVGAILGGAIAHWRRGASHILTGAIIGAALACLLAILGAVYTTIAIGLGLAALAFFVIYAFFFG